jgi:hypothetical protein
LRPVLLRETAGNGFENLPAALVAGQPVKRRRLWYIRIRPADMKPRRYPDVS